MPVLRLFAAAREAAGEARVELDGPTVGDVLAQAQDRYGDGFTIVLERSRVWVNGHPAELTDELGTHDVVAVLPPVSGGAGGAATSAAAPPPTAPAADQPLLEDPFGPLPAFADPAEGADLPGVTDIAAAGGSPAEGWSQDPQFEAPPAADQPSADDLLDRLAGLPPFPSDDPVFGESSDPDADLLPGRSDEPAYQESYDAGWGPGGGPSWSLGEPAPESGPRSPAVDEEPEPDRDLWSWPVQGPDEAPEHQESAPSSPFAPSPDESSDWDRRQTQPVSPPEPDPRPPEPPSALSLAQEPAVRILGPDQAPVPATPPVQLGDEPAVRILAGERPATPPDRATPSNGSGTRSPSGRTRLAPVADDPAHRVPAAGVLVDESEPTSAASAVPSAPPDAPTAAEGSVGGDNGTSAAALATAPAAAPSPGKAKSKTQPLAVVAKSTRPHGRLGFLWVGITVAAIVAGPEATGIWLAACAAVAGLQNARVWRARNERPLLPLAAATAAALPLCAISGLRAMTAAVVVAVVVGLLARLFSLTKAPARDVGLTLAIGLVIGLAVASVVLLRNINVHAPLLLLTFAAAYDAGAYLVGTGASSTWEGPVAGVLTAIPVTMLSAVVFVPPFPDGSPLVLGLIAAVLIPCGPLAGSALLGERDADAPALRRLDSLLVVAPVWAWCAAAFLS